MSDVIHNTIKVIEYLVFTLLLVILFAIASPLLPFKTFIATYVVTSGSMEPTFSTGSLVFTGSVEPNSLNTGDVITFTSPSDPKSVVIHRIVEKGTDNASFKTKGDNNDSADNWTVLATQVKGKALFGFAKLGYAVMWLKNPIGFSVGICIPALLLIIFQILKIKDGINEEVDRRTKKALQRQNVNTAVVAVMLAFSLSFAPSTIYALFTASATITGINLTVGSTQPSDVGLLFYPYDDKKSVGFTLHNVKNYKTIKYVVTYDHDEGTGGAMGEIDNMEGKDTIVSNRFELNVCSDGVCTYHTGIEEVFLTITLVDEDENETILNRSLMLSEPGAYELPEACAALMGTIFNKIEGTQKSNILVGTDGNDLILGISGNNKIDGKGGNDCIVGGPGNSIIDGGSGDDILIGGDGNNVIKGGEGNDRIFGGNGNNVLYGNEGDNFIVGGDGNDVIYGGDGDDELWGGAGNDVIRGGDGDDMLDGGNGRDVLDGGNDTDTCLNGPVMKNCEL